LSPADKCGVDLVKVFHLYRGFHRKKSYVGDFVKVSIKKTNPESLIKKKSKIKSILIRTKFSAGLIDGVVYNFKENNLILLKKRLSSRGKEIVGPSSRKLNRKKFLFSLAGFL
jgi:large subunit ribosomal protein L14